MIISIINYQLSYVRTRYLDCCTTGYMALPTITNKFSILYLYYILVAHCRNELSKTRLILPMSELLTNQEVNITLQQINYTKH